MVLLQPAELLEDMKGFLRSLGMLLHTNLRLKLDEKQEPMVYPYYGIENNDNLHTGASAMKRLGKRELGKEVIGYVCLNLNCVAKKVFLYKSNVFFFLLVLYRSKVHLEIDNRQCTQTFGECFSSTDLAASYIAAESLKAELHYPVFSVDSMSGLRFIILLLSYIHLNFLCYCVK